MTRTGKDQLSVYAGLTISQILAMGLIEMECWEFADSRENGGHRGVENAGQTHPKRKIMERNYRRKRAEEQGNW